MNKLIPLQVPWQVSSGWTGLVGSFTELGTTNVSFIANALITMADSSEKEVLSNDSSMQIENIRFQEIYVTMNFLGGIVKTMPALTDTYPIDVSKYDWSAIDLYFRPHHTLQNPDELARWKWANERNLEIWFKTGICPTPHIYEVQDSEWLESLKSQISQEPLKHFLIPAHDASVELIAYEWSWSSRPLDDDDIIDVIEIPK